MLNQDLTLLREYATGNSETAFAALVERHIHLVYSVALRQVRDPHLAEEVTQAVFIILARKAGSLGDNIILPGWLCRVARYASAKAVRTQLRRQRREQEAFMQSILDRGGDASSQPEIWKQIAPLLDHALDKLSRKDHDALVLRFFQKKNFADVGAALGASEDAAKMRVSRALEKLRRFFHQRGVDSTAATIAENITARSIQAAPAALAKSVTAVAMAKGAAASASTLTLIQGALKIMAWTKAKIAIVVSACVLLTAGTTSVTIYNMGKPMRSIESEWSAISGDNGQWSWAGGKIEGHSVTGDGVLASSKKYGDVTFSAVVGTPNREATLAFRLQDATNGYSVVFAPGTTPGNDGPGFVRLNKIINATETRLGTYQGKRMVAAGKPAKIKVVAQGSLLEVFLNGASIVRAHDSTFTNGYIGLRIYGWADAPCDATFSSVNFR